MGRETAELFGRVREHFADWLADDEEEGEETPSEELASEPTSSALSRCYLALLTSTMSPEALDSFVERLRITRRDARLLGEVSRLRDTLADLQAEVMLPSTLYRLLHPFSREARFALSVLTEAERVRARLERYERELADVSPRVGGVTLRQMGAPPGPVYGVILERVRDALLDGLVTTEDEERELARRLVQAAQVNGERERRGR
jgi:hypothetical protein